MHFQFLIEDQSSAVLIRLIMEKIRAIYPEITYDDKAYKGLGGFTKKNTVKETKEGKLLNDLATVLRGFNKSLQYIPAVIIIVLDNDTRDPSTFLVELEAVAEQNHIKVDHVFCLAIEEVEAWLLGDEAALFAAYPNAKTAVLRSYVQDSICGTWELLADAVYPGGLRKFRKDCPSYIEVGQKKSEWAKEIGSRMNLHENKSPSFQSFLSEIDRRLPA